MNNLDIHNRNDAMNQDRQSNGADDRTMETGQKIRRRRRWGGRLFALGGFLLLAGALSLGARGAHSKQQDVMATARQERDFVPGLRVATVGASPGTVSVALPGTTEAFSAANIYSRATGYIAKRNADIGDRVKAGDLLAELAVPELDDQIAQGEATLNQLKSTLEQDEAGLRLAQVTWGRDSQLVRDGWMTRQQGDVDIRNLQGQEASVAAARHTLWRRRTWSSSCARTGTMGRWWRRSTA